MTGFERKNTNLIEPTYSITSYVTIKRMFSFKQKTIFLERGGGSLNYNPFKKVTRKILNDKKPFF